MKRILLLAATAAILTGCENAAEETTEEEVVIEEVSSMDKAKAQFALDYPDAVDGVWEDREGNFQVSYRKDNVERHVIYDMNGGKVREEMILAEDAVPAGAKAYVAEQGGSVIEATMITKANGTVEYEVQSDGKNLLFDKDGTFLRENIEALPEETVKEQVAE